MDPLAVLPKELVLDVCALLSPVDLASMAQLSRAWRNVFSEPSVWTNVEVDTETIDRRSASRVFRIAPRLKSVALSSEKVAEDLLHSDALVSGLDFHNYRGSAEIVKLLLSKFAASLESLELWDVSLDVLLHLRDLPLPCLRCLTMSGVATEEWDEDGSIDWWQDGGASASTLVELVLFSVEPELLRPLTALITAHRHTLRILELGLISGGGAEDVDESGPELLLKAVAQCKKLTSLDMCSTGGSDLQVLSGQLPELRTLRLELIHDFDPEEEMAQGGQAVPDFLPSGLLASLEELCLQLTFADDLVVLGFLVKRAPSLVNLKTLTLEMSGNSRDVAERLLSAALPGVKLSFDTWDDSDTDSDSDSESDSDESSPQPECTPN